MRQVESASASGVTTAGSPAILNVSDHAFPDVDGNWTGFPKQTGQSLSYWLQGVRCDPLLDHRSTPDLPASADIVIIGSGVSCSVPFAVPTVGDRGVNGVLDLLTFADHGNFGCQAVPRNVA